MKVYILQLGDISLDENLLITSATRGTLSNPNAPSNWISVPVWAVLIETHGHRIVYDLGCLPDAMDEGGWPKQIQQNLPLTRKPEEYIEKQLALIGLETTDIDTVIVSHMHADHFGGIELFGHCDVYVPREEWIAALIKTHENDNPDNGGSYIKRSIEFPVKKYHTVEAGDDFELFPGLRIITLPGHAPNLLGLLLTLKKEGTLIFPSDAVSTGEIYNGRMGTYCNAEAFAKSVEKVRRLQAGFNAKVMISHDRKLYDSFKKAPDYYE